MLVKYDIYVCMYVYPPTHIYNLKKDLLLCSVGGEADRKSNS